MSSFAQYYIRYLHEFAPYDWEKRQEYLAAFFEADDSIEFAIGEGDKRKVFNHRVYHLQNNPRIVIMQFANSIDIPVEIAYEHTFAKDEPSCFVIIDNRDNLRSVLIQKRKQAFGNPGQVAKIIGGQISDRMFKEKCYSMEILPEYYPEDLFEAWEKLQQTAMAMRFGVPEMTPDEIMQKVEALKSQHKEYYDDSLMQSLLQLAVEAKKAKYKQLYTVMPEDKQTALYVDKTSVFMKNLLTLSRAIDMPVELVTKDAGTFRCFVETDEDNTDKIVCREFNAGLLENLFRRCDKDGNELEPAAINKIEGEIVEMLNGMKHEPEDEEAQAV